MELSWTNFPDLTLLIRRAHAGDAAAGRKFFSLAYQHLKKLASVQLKREIRRNNMTADELLHDVYLSRIRFWSGDINDRNHYAARVCLALRDELRDRARRRDAQKRREPTEERRGGNWAASSLSLEETLTVERELERLAECDAETAHVVWLRYYAGCSWLETANATGRSVKAVRIDWEFASDWLRKRLGHKFF